MGDTKEMILKTSLDLFARDGYDAVSVSQIAGALGMTKGALYKHYKSKRDIFDCIVARMEEYDRVATERYSMPEYGQEAKITCEQLASFALAQFRFWTEDEFASSFRKMLTVEQFRTEKSQSLYQQYIAGGPLCYVEQIFTEMGVPDAGHKALEFFAPMHLCYSLFDAGGDANALYMRLQVHFSKFEQNFSQDKYYI